MNPQAPPTHLTSTLKDACKLVNAAWAVVIRRAGDEWITAGEYGLTKKKQKLLGAFFQNQSTLAWLAGALSNGRLRWRSCASEMGCRRLYAFPQPAKQALLLLGTDHLEKNEQEFLRLLTSTLFPPLPDSVAATPAGGDTRPRPFPALSLSHAAQTPPPTDLEASYNPQRALDLILEGIVAQVPSQAACLAIRYGQVFHIQSIWNLPVELGGFDLPIQEGSLISKMVSSRHGRISKDFTPIAPLRPDTHNESSSSWMGIPILIGRQVIGLVILLSSPSRPFDEALLSQTSLQVQQLATNVESAIVINETTRYMQQLALLNELASTASLGIDKDEFSRRVMHHLRRTFDTDWASILLLSPDGASLQEYGGSSQRSPSWIVPVQSSLMGLSIETGLPVRYGDVQLASRYFPIYPGTQSELVVPLKYRGVITGVLALVSTRAHAFSIQDEQLLVVIASHMAGWFENVRLHEETRERALKLQDSVRQLQAVRETALDLAGDLDLNTLLLRVAQRARLLVDARGAELGFIIEEDNQIEIMVSDTPWEKSQGKRLPLMAGISGRLAAFGEPLLVKDYPNWPGRLNPDQAADITTAAGVPLKFRGQVIGTLAVLDNRPDKVFDDQDIQLLELLAPQAAISIRNARLYQELQERIDAQQLAESRLIRSARLAAVGEMAAGIAHELNNPLTTVSGFAELILDELPPDDPHHAELALVLQEANRARSVVRRLLDFSRPVEDQRKRTDVNELINQVLALTHHLLHASGVTLTTSLSQDLPWISMDSEQIKQVLVNLVNNAIQSMPTGGKLTIQSAFEMRGEADRLERWVTIAVCDNGVGIQPEIMDRLFEPFFTTRPAGKGTGLGLSVSYGIIASHGGYIDVTSQVGAGSCFKVYLPAALSDIPSYGDHLG